LCVHENLGSFRGQQFTYLVAASAKDFGIMTARDWFSVINNIRALISLRGFCETSARFLKHSFSICFVTRHRLGSYQKDYFQLPHFPVADVFLEPHSDTTISQGLRSSLRTATAAYLGAVSSAFSSNSSARGIIY